MSALSVLLLQATSAQAETRVHVRNGSFTDPHVTENSYRTFGVGNGIDGWTVTQGSVDLLGSGFAQRDGYVQAVDLNGDGRGAIRTQIDTTPRHRVYVHFKATASADPRKICTGSNIPEALLRVQGEDGKGAFESLGKPDANAVAHWQDYTFEYTATRENGFVTFSSVNDSACGPWITDVRVYESDRPEGIPIH
ncbi:DUF642 domain-containing protein [Streptomyces sp. LARHCF249]